MEEYGNNGTFGVDRKHVDEDSGWGTRNLFGVALVDCASAWIVQVHGLCAKCASYPPAAQFVYLTTCF